LRATIAFPLTVAAAIAACAALPCASAAEPADAAQTVRVAAVQFISQWGKPAENRKGLEPLVRQAAKHGARIVVLPETAITGYTSHDLRRTWQVDKQAVTEGLQGVSPKDVAEEVPGESTRAFGALAKELGIYLTVPFLEVDPKQNKYYNTIVLVGPDGRTLLHYRKLNPWPWAEQGWATQGDRGHQFVDTPYGRLALLICYDINFEPPELKKNRVDHLLYCIAWVDHAGSDWFAKRLPRIARQADVNIIGANWSVPERPKWHGYGQSLIIGRTGEVVAKVKNDLGNEIIYADLPIPAPAGKGFQFTTVDDKSLKLTDGDAPVLVYNHGLITSAKVPEKDRRRSRACYVHPLWGLNGEVLTDDFPKDHYHHHGIFWTWPHIGIDGKEYNLWDGDNIHDKFVRWIAREAGPVAAVLAVENGWFVGDKKVMIERVWLRVYKASQDSRALDLEFTWIPVDRPITLRGAEGKSYGGLTVRFAPGPRKDTLITVPSGPTTKDLPDTRLPWADFTSKFGGAVDGSGAAIFVHPNHPDYPPTWLTRYYGPMCVGYPGVKAQTFEPGKPIRLSYRIWIHKGAVDLDRLKQAYQGYTEAAKVKWE